MKASGARNRIRQQNAETHRLREMNTRPKLLALLAPEQRKEAQDLLDLIYWGLLTDPDKEKQAQELNEAPESSPPKPTPKRRPRQT